MFEVQLFLGFPVDTLYSQQLAKANSNVVSQFIQNDGVYLREIQYDNMQFFGKEVGKVVTLSQLELLEDNIYSLLKKIVPEFPYHETPLYLFSITDDES